MGTTNETLTPLGSPITSHRIAILPSNLYGSFTADDTDDHIFKCAGRGKGRLTLAVDNPANTDATITLYGMHSLTGAIGDVGTFPIGSSFTALATAKDYETCNDAFPYYLVKVTYAIVATDTPKKTCTVYVDLSAF